MSTESARSAVDLAMRPATISTTNIVALTSKTVVSTRC
jgi:hypothetical protein